MLSSFTDCYQPWWARWGWLSFFTHRRDLHFWVSLLAILQAPNLVIPWDGHNVRAAHSHVKAASCTDINQATSSSCQGREKWYALSSPTRFPFRQKADGLNNSVLQSGSQHFHPRKRRRLSKMSLSWYCHDEPACATSSSTKVRRLHSSTCKRTCSQTTRRFQGSLPTLRLSLLHRRLCFYRQ